MSRTTVADDRWCIACGENNPWGLHLRFRWEGDDLVSDFVPQRVHQGWAGVTHGGVLCILLDEVMNNLLCYTVGAVVTAELSVRFRNPAPVGVPVQVRARLTGSRMRLHQAEAEAVLPDGTVLATGTAKLMQVEGDLSGRRPDRDPCR